MSILKSIFDKEEKKPVDKGFSLYNKYIKKSQEFGRPKLTKAGKEFDVYDWIQENREDTEIYPTLEKYGSLKRMELDTDELYGDFSELKDLRGIHDQIEKSNQMWENLPIEIRKEFNMNPAEFMEKGEEWLKEITKPKQPEPNEPKQGE